MIHSNNNKYIHEGSNDLHSVTVVVYLVFILKYFLHTRDILWIVLLITVYLNTDIGQNDISRGPCSADSSYNVCILFCLPLKS
jgi:hypothetical protein